MDNLKAEVWGTRNPVEKTKVEGWELGNIVDGIEVEDEDYLRSDYVQVLAGAKYRVEVNSDDADVKVVYYNEHKIYWGTEEYQEGEEITIKSGAKYVRIVLNKDLLLIGDDDYNGNLKVELLASGGMNYGFDADVPNREHICDCMIRLDLWKGTTENKPDIVGKVGIGVNVWKGDHIKITTSGTETGSRGIDDTPVGQKWEFVVQEVRVFGNTKELEMKYA